MIPGIIESKTLTKDVSCECKCRFDGKKCNLNQWANNGKCWCECKKIHICKVIMIMYVMIMFGILLHVIVKMKNI